MNLRNIAIDLFQFLERGTRHLYGVCAGLFGDGEVHARRAVDSNDIAGAWRPFFDAGNFSQLDRRPFLCRDDGIAEFLDIDVFSRRSDRDFQIPLLHRPARHILIGGAEIGHDLIQRQAECVNIFNAKVDVDFSFRSAENIERRDAGNPLHTIFHLRFQQIAGFDGIKRRGCANHQNRHGGGVEFAQRRAFRLFRQTGNDAVEPVANIVRRFREVCAPCETQPHRTPALRRG